MERIIGLGLLLFGIYRMKHGKFAFISCGVGIGLLCH